MDFREWQREIFGRKMVVQYGKVAKQSAGSIWLRFGDSIVLATVNISDRVVEGIDFVPLTVEYQEKFYAAGKIPGGFIKREGRPTESGILSSRLIDRPIRPLFPKYLRNDVQLIVTVLSVDNDSPPDVAGITAASLALNISKIPFDGIVAGVRIGYVDGEFVVFPTEEQLEKSKLDLVVAGSKEAITMVEGEAKEISEEEMVKALMTAHDAIKKIIDFEEEILREFNVEKMNIEEPKPNEVLLEEFEKLLDEKELKERLLTKEKLERSAKLKEYRDNLLEKIFEKNPIEDEEELKIQENLLKELFDEKAKKLMRKIIINEGIRADGRKPDEIRPITCELGLLPRTHGSALFTRGETQSLGIVTLGAPMEEQIVDTLTEEGTKRFILHYNFPPFSVGEVKPLRGPGRREIGHGHLAERALKAVAPSEDDFPYVIRVVSEILESNGSSSMATVCSGSLALMDAGVPIKTHVAGVAMGLIIEEGQAVILTDIQGLEDHWGDMDFKVAGTREGITAFQMDCKVAGVGEDLLKQALEQARVARMKILDIMFETIEKPRETLSPHAPLIVNIQIDPLKVGELIGPGGKVIKSIVKDYDVEISIDDKTGKVSVYGKDQEKVNNAVEYIKSITKDVEVGEFYDGKIIRIEPYGLFVEILPGKIGLAHVSKLGKDSKVFTKKYKIGDNIKVVVVNIDENGRIQLGKSE
ncbi:polyribonucleotide nucleotidyltransferase [Thermosipho atlanticus]|uniref:Polyribonucleotide nucleotidyltransferase n=1 Tax=Thermosipho atlanticus DSM 15807 TaxID=1123380 RepID=A0A1M5R8N0_9BACT|nr:polyribonucleotide nucleotidyltransferase [Thermosipho atlanticus]SHH22717.1 polyribonucleotide nucleotidyltransferase [Thermosipho atlanticus DSM 15807]